MNTLKLFWFFLWRMPLWGLLLCVAAMVVMNVVIQVSSILAGRGWLGPVYAVVWAVVFGTAGAIIGLFLGLLCGTVHFVLTRTFFWPRLAYPDRYRRTAGRACVLVSILPLMADWMIHGWCDRYTFGSEENDFFDPFTFILWRILQGHEDSTVDFDLTWAFNLTIMIVVPTLLFALAMWWTGRRVAGRYVEHYEATESQVSRDSGEDTVERTANSMQ